MFVFVYQWEYKKWGCWPTQCYSLIRAQSNGTADEILTSAYQHLVGFRIIDWYIPGNPDVQSILYTHEE